MGTRLRELAAGAAVLRWARRVRRAVGLRLRLRAGVDLSGFPTQARMILRAMQTYGLIVADNGSSGFIGGVPDPRWDNDALHQLGRITLADFDAVDESSLRVSADSAAYRGGVATAPAQRSAPTPRPAATSTGSYQVLVPHRPMSAEPAVVAGPLAGLRPARPAAAGGADAEPAAAKVTILGVPAPVAVGIALALLMLAALFMVMVM